MFAICHRLYLLRIKSEMASIVSGSVLETIPSPPTEAVNLGLMPCPCKALCCCWLGSHILYI